MLNLAELTEGREQFLKTIPGLQFAWDSTSLGAFKKCPRNYFYSIICGYRPKREALPLTFGIYFHSALERYDRDRAKGVNHEQATRNAVRVALTCGGTTDTKLVCSNCKWEPNQVYDECPMCAMTGTITEGQVYRPWTTDCTKRNRENLVRSVVWYVEQFQNDHLQTVILKDGTPAVELSFRMGSGYHAPDGTEYLLCGYIDRLVTLGEGGPLFVTDRKTTTAQPGEEYFQRYSPDTQMTQYTLAGQVVFDMPARGIIIDAAQVAVGFSRFHRGMVHRTPGQLEEWLADLRLWLTWAEQCATSGHYPMNDKACFNCNFRGICGKDEAVRESFLETDFFRQDWNPLAERTGE